MALLSACGGDDDDAAGPEDGGPSDDAGVDGGADAGLDAAPDAGDDGGGSASCDAPLEGTFAVDPDGPDTQIYSSAAANADGTGVWIAYCRPEAGDTGLFDVLVVELDCDGTPLQPPVVVSGAGNDIAPSLARSGDRLLVSWMRDRGEGLDNLDIVYRVVGTDGVVLGETESVLETTRGGAAVAGNALDPAVAVAPDGFVLAGARADDELSTFQVFVQRLDGDGALVGEAIDAGLEPGVTQTGPAVAVGADGRTWLAWVRESGDASDVWFRALDEDTVPEPAFEGLVAAEAPVLAVDPEDPARVWLAATADTRVRVDVLLTDVGLPLAERPTLSLGDSREIDHTPELVATPGGGAVLYHRVVSGIRNEVVLQSFHAVGPDLDADAEVSLARDEPAGPYPLGFAAVAEGTLLAAWSDGTSPAFRLRARFAREPN